MRKFLINVNGNTYEVEVEEVSSPGMPSRTFVSNPVPSPTPRPNPTPQLSPAEPAPTASAAATEQKAASAREAAEEMTVSAGQEVVEAPMPGNIWKIVANEGDEVKSGDVLLILEAMKMENEIVAPRDGKVVKITTTEGATVNTGDKLVIIE